MVATDRYSLADCFNAARFGACAYLPKPVTAAMIIVSVEDIRPAGQTDFPLAVVPSLARYEWEYLAWVMATCGGNKSRASRMLGISRGSLQRKLAKLPPSPPVVGCLKSWQ